MTIAILLHDIGHGPYSHALEHSIVSNISHEDISELLMERLNAHFKGKLDMAIRIFGNNHKKKLGLSSRESERYINNEEDKEVE